MIMQQGSELLAAWPQWRDKFVTMMVRNMGASPPEAGSPWSEETSWDASITAEATELMEPPAAGRAAASSSLQPRSYAAAAARPSRGSGWRKNSPRSKFGR